MLPARAATPVTFVAPAASGVSSFVRQASPAGPSLPARLCDAPSGRHRHSGRLQQRRASSKRRRSVFRSPTCSTPRRAQPLPTATTVGSLSAQHASGYYAATIKGVSTAGSAFVCGGTATPVKCAFPAGAKLRAVGLQSPTHQQATAPASTAAAGIRRHAIAVVKAVTEVTRRAGLSSTRPSAPTATNGSKDTAATACTTRRSA